VKCHADDFKAGALIFFKRLEFSWATYWK